MAVMVIGVGVLYSSLLQTKANDYIPFFCVSMLSWTLISTVLVDACNAFILAEGLIKQMKLPFTAHVLRILWRNLIVFFHHLVLYVLVILYFGISPWATLPMLIPALLLWGIVGFSFGLTLGMFCARYRDVPQVVASVTQIMMFFSPVLWKPDHLGAKYQVLVMANPVYHFMEILRGPMLGYSPAPISWLFCSVFAAAAAGVTFMFFSRFRSRIAYWV